ncbi:hypothetical protein CZ771_05080 [Actinomycetales bacterium JB111]|nr:hypothetical protein CZ771_05080 [Actinomycetales bacterium JB111]
MAEDDLETPPDTATTDAEPTDVAPASPRWPSIVSGVVVGAVLGGLAFATVGWLRSDPIDPVVEAYLNEEDLREPVGPHQLAILLVRDVQQPSSFPDLAAPGGDHYVTLTLGLESGEGRDEWVDLADYSVEVLAVDADGETEALVPTSDTLTEFSGSVRGQDPYWIEGVYAPPTRTAESYEVRVHTGDETVVLVAPADERDAS